MEQFDAIVVGAGPAGATAARNLAIAGRRVLLIERSTLPRYKACGGGLGPKTTARLPFPIQGIPHVRLEQITFRLRGDSPVVWDLPEGFPFFMVMRADLDNALVQAALAEGAHLAQGEAVRSVDQGEGGCIVTTDRGQYQARFVVGADGATGVTRRCLGLRAGSQVGVALECELAVPNRVYERFRANALFDVEAAPDGYGWVFPKGSHLSVGLGSMVRQGSSLRGLLHEFILRYDLASAAELEHLPVHVHPLPVATSGERASVGRVLLAGDAAGVADGFGGEGVCYAMASGELAADVVRKALQGDILSVDNYTAELDRLIRHDHGFANLMGRIVRRFPDAGYRILTSVGEGKSVLIPLLLGEFSFGESLRRLPRLAALASDQRV
ncbi:MAG: geranylgeranyl reductase family protein [Chloroflexota bacterium]